MVKHVYFQSLARHLRLIIVKSALPWCSRRAVHVESKEQNIYRTWWYSRWYVGRWEVFPCLCTLAMCCNIFVVIYSHLLRLLVNQLLACTSVALVLFRYTPRDKIRLYRVNLYLNFNISPLFSWLYYLILNRIQ